MVKLYTEETKTDTSNNEAIQIVNLISERMDFYKIRVNSNTRTIMILTEST